MQDPTIKIDASGNGEITFRTGKAPDIQPPVPIIFKGQIQAPRVFYEARKEEFSPTNSHVVVSLEEKTICLKQNDRSAFANEITGELEFSPEYKALGINSDVSRSPQALAKVLKRYRFLFTDSHEGFKVIADLMAFKGSMKADVEASKDERGNKRNSVSVSVESNIPIEFNMRLPLFAGQPFITVTISILLESEGQSINCFLESLGALERINTEALEIITKEIQPFIDAGLPILDR
jgi:hypothetical protein